MSNPRKRKLRAKKSPPRDGEKDDGKAAEHTMATAMTRITDAPTRAGKVNALINALDLMRSIQVDPQGAQPGRGAREQRIFDETAVANFFGALGRPDLANDFLGYAFALSDLDRGVVHKTLEPAPRSGGPTPNSSDVWRGRAYVAAAVNTLHRARLQIKDIKRIIDFREELRPLLDEKQKLAGKHALGDAAEGWRKQFNAREVNNFGAANTYDFCQNTAAARGGPDELNKYAEWLLWRATTIATEIKQNFS